MSDSNRDGQSNSEEAVAEVRREFNAGLPGRLETLESALDELMQEFDSAAAETFFFNAHSLKGTAGAFGAEDLVEPAKQLSDMARGWLKRGHASDRELSDVRAELVRLQQAVTAYLRT